MNILDYISLIDDDIIFERINVIEMNVGTLWF